MGRVNEVRGGARVLVRLLPALPEALMWVKPKDATLGTRVDFRPMGRDYDYWRTAILVAQVGPVWWLDIR